jgi:hypothetical protein
MQSQELWPGCTACHPQCSHRRNHSKASSLLGLLANLPHSHWAWWWPFLSTFSRGDQHRLVTVFTAAVQANDIQSYTGASAASAPVSSTVCAAIDAIAQTYRANNWLSPIHNHDGNLAFILQWVLKGYANTDPSEKPQKAINPRVIRGMLHSTTTPEDIACNQLAGGTFFFAMWSCECTKVTGDWHTKLLCLENLLFFHGEQEIRHSHHDLHLADTISITFIFQKNDKRDATVTQHRTFNDELCPVKCWAAIVKRIVS